MLHYAVVDCANDQRLYWLVQRTRTHTCLFAGKLDRESAAAAPWLVLLEADSELSRLWQMEGLDKPWGIRLQSDRNIDELCRHFRHFLLVNTPDAKLVLFRFYDPRVWTVYWKTLDEKEKRAWTAPGIAFLTV
jgi:Domain of unknown function (DUF4123)